MRKSIVAAGLAVELLLAGCGVGQTGVIDAGPPGLLLTRPATVSAIYYLDHNEVPQPIGAPNQVQPDEAIAQLFGPIPDSATRAGLHTALPSVAVQFSYMPSQAVRLVVPAELTPPALAQVACTLTQSGAWRRAIIVTADRTIEANMDDCPQPPR